MSSQWFNPEVLLFLPYCPTPRDGGVSRQYKTLKPTRDLYFGVGSHLDTSPPVHTPSEREITDGKQNHTTTSKLK